MAKDKKKKKKRGVKEQATVLGNIGWFYYNQGNYPEAFKHCEEALQIFKQLGDLNGKAISLKTIALIHYKQGNYQDASKHLEDALNVFLELGLEDSPKLKQIKDLMKIIKSKLS